jgi:hypothetical protein
LDYHSRLEWGCLNNQCAWSGCTMRLLAFSRRPQAQSGTDEHEQWDGNGPWSPYTKKKLINFYVFMAPIRWKNPAFSFFSNKGRMSDHFAFGLMIIGNVWHIKGLLQEIPSGHSSQGICDDHLEPGLPLNDSFYSMKRRIKIVHNAKSLRQFRPNLTWAD